MSQTAFILLAIGALSLATASVTLYKTIAMLKERRAEYRERKTILAEGTPAKAVVNSIRQTAASMNGQPEVVLDVTIAKPDGGTVDAVFQTFVPIVHIPGFQKGCTIDVKYAMRDRRLVVEAVDAYLP